MNLIIYIGKVDSIYYIGNESGGRGRGRVES